MTPKPKNKEKSYHLTKRMAKGAKCVEFCYNVKLEYMSSTQNLLQKFLCTCK